MIFSAPVVTIRLTCERKKAILGHFLGNHRLELGKNRLMDPSKIFYGGHCVPHWTWHVPPGRHPGQTLWGVFAGAGRLRVGDEEFSLSAGDVFRLDYQQEVHGIQDRDDWLRIRYVDFEPDDALPVQAMPTSRHFDHLQFLGELFDRLERACRPEQSAEKIVWLEALMTEYQMEASPHRMTLYSAKIDALCRLFQSHAGPARLRAGSPGPVGRHKKSRTGTDSRPGACIFKRQRPVLLFGADCEEIERIAILAAAHVQCPDFFIRIGVVEGHIPHPAGIAVFRLPFQGFPRLHVF